MNSSSSPQSTNSKLPVFPNLPQINKLLPDTSTMKTCSQFCPSLHGAFRPVNPTKTDTVATASFPQLTVVQPKTDTNIASLKPLNDKGNFPPCNEEKEKGRQGRNSEDKRAKRAEKNRKFAKESRDRKRKYIQDLEAEVKHLREQLETHRQILKKYELLEKYSNIFGKEVYSTLVSVYREMHDAKQPASDHSVFVETLKKKVNEALEEQNHVLAQITKVMMRIMLPLPLRIAAWLSEKDIDLHDCESALIKLGPEVSIDHAKMIVNYMKELYPDKDKYCEMQANLANTGKNIKSLMKQMIECTSKVQMELVNYGKYLDTVIVPYSQPRLLGALSNLSPCFNRIPELSDNAILQNSLPIPICPND
eukprot:TRINITY_DN7202_c0_g1_i3.p1 TRINITY_DN7202_c0_g1~~TRINITY_DN7202_c0_g1_i3.p1  ORF type:complete len:364 (-),score=80.19 TRINITY_DN7202_c0_g1_i3:143-1234(-)